MLSGTWIVSNICITSDYYINYIVVSILDWLIIKEYSCIQLITYKLENKVCMDLNEKII